VVWLSCCERPFIFDESNVIAEVGEILSALKGKGNPQI